MEKIQDLFIKLVKIDSPFSQEKELADFVIKELKKLNLIIKKDKFGNIIARGRKFNKKDSTLICAHLDTIESNKGIKPRIKKGIIHSDGKHILGADNKAAIAEIIYALQGAKDLSNVELLFTVQEENGLFGAKNLNKKLIKSKKALVLDYSFPPGYIVLKTPSAVIMEIEISGRSVHSARANSEHNAISVSGACAVNLTSCIDPGINCNIGMISGGTAINVSPASVKMTSELRSFSEAKLNTFIKKNEKELKKIASSRNCRISIKKMRVGYPYSYNKDDKLIKDIIEKFKQLNIKTKLKNSFGLSDANVLNKYGIKAIELGYGPKNVHTNKESIAINQMEKMSEFLTRFFSGVDRGSLI